MPRIHRSETSWTLLAPGAGYTHWKQTVFYFPDYATMKQNEEVEGKFSCKVDLENTVSVTSPRTRGEDADASDRLEKTGLRY